ncbi:hypothetical protein L6164_024006 [Bauhinia variegata]|uniref:Uncharacterized protein n=1 Tax=Bauhinia variegata TaxID=167791 RepID=A0ACB9LXE9_BAUVA|nr:hypothetical protein L6164_024006 [Bauhinia variegata]
MNNNIPAILCKLEKVFALALFDVMEHLSIHLKYEAMVGGLVQYHSYNGYKHRDKLNEGKRPDGNSAKLRHGTGEVAPWHDVLERTSKHSAMRCGALSQRAFYQCSPWCLEFMPWLPEHVLERN